MKTTVTTGIVLARTNYGEADRIVTLLTPDQGKLRVMAKGVRRPKSKLAGGIELFSVGEITYMPGKGDLGTLISARLKRYYDQIVKDINRTMQGYELLKKINKITEDAAEVEYFDLLLDGLAGLDDLAIDLELWELWQGMQLLRLTGHTPNLQTDTAGDKLTADGHYVFSYDDMAFAPTPQGEAIAGVTKLLRLASSEAPLKAVSGVSGVEAVIAPALQLARTMQKYSLKI